MLGVGRCLEDMIIIDISEAAQIYGGSRVPIKEYNARVGGEPEMYTNIYGDNDTLKAIREVLGGNKL